MRYLPFMALIAIGLNSPVTNGQEKVKYPAKEDEFILQKSSDELTAPEKVDPKSLERPVPETRLSIKHKRLEAFAKESSLVFHGKVIGKSYSKTVDDKSYFSNVPLTFVEFQVLDILAGEYEGERFTLRYAGGPRNADEFLIVTHINNFNIGDEEIISINGNGYVMDPVIGRFRIFEDAVYTASGHKIITNTLGDELLVSKERAKNKTLDFIQIGNDSFSSVNNLPVESPDMDQGSQSPQPDNLLRPLKTNEIKKMIKENIRKRSQTFTSSEESASPASHREFKNTKNK